MIKPNIDQIREYTTRKDVAKWLPSVPGGDNFLRTFLLPGKNIDGSKSDGEINTLTEFKETQPGGLYEEDLKRFVLIMACFKQQPYHTALTEATKGNILLTNEISGFLDGIQTGNGQPCSRGLTADIVRYYRGSKLKDSPPDDEKNIQSLLNYSRSSSDYKKNVAGVLGRVTYDSVVKHTLYSLLLSNGLISDELEKKAGDSWIDKATNLPPNNFGLFIDAGGGPYARAFPVICVYTKAASSTKESDLFEKANSFVSSKLSRTPTKEELVSPIRPGGKKESFLTVPISTTGDSVFCFLYDFVEVITLDQSSIEDSTLDVLKIALSLLSTKTLTFDNKENLRLFAKEMEVELLDNFGDVAEEGFFSIVYKIKHGEECKYSLDRGISTALNKNFKIQFKKILSSLVSVMEEIGNKFNDTENIKLHFDNFYNLLAATTTKSLDKNPEKTYPESIPFNMKEYEINKTESDLLVKFYSDPGTLPNYPAGKSDYKYNPEIGLGLNIKFVTDVFLKQVYENLDSSGVGLVYELDDNRRNDNSLSFTSIKLLQEINKRTSNKVGNKHREDYFIYSPGNITLKSPVVQKINLSSLNLSFEGTGEDKIKLQTVCFLLNVNKNQIKPNPTIETFVDLIYYPRIQDGISETVKTPSEDQLPVLPPTTTTADAPKNNNYLINNIISSELACYEDIADSFDKAINAEGSSDKLYYAFQTLVHTGLPFLLTYAAQKLAAKLQELAEGGADKSLLECLLSDRNNLKKAIITFADLLLNGDPESLLLQQIPELPQIPEIIFLSTFDAEKELKRKLLDFIIKKMIDLLKSQLNLSIQPLVDMCNADSYLNAFLDLAYSNKTESTGNKVGAPSPSGLPIIGSSTTHIPHITVDINDLIERTGLETKSFVYEEFRTKYCKGIQGHPVETYTDDAISSFFENIGIVMEMSEMAALLRGTGSLSTKNVILSRIRNYINQFSILFEDIKSVADLFVFLADYIDYIICLEIIGAEARGFTPTVCFDVNSNFDNLVNKFGEEAVTTQVTELSNQLNDLCVLKSPLKIDLFADGPSFLTEKLRGLIETSYGTITTSFSNLQNDLKYKDYSLDSKSGKYAKVFSSLDLSDQNGATRYYLVLFLLFVFNDAVWVDNPIKPVLENSNNHQNGGYHTKIVEGIIDSNTFDKKDYNKQFKLELASVGNEELKTNPVIFNGYNKKLKQYSFVPSVDLLK